MAAQCIFPAELIGQILYRMDPLDVVRLRTVSKWFRTLTYDRVLWTNMYADAPYPRPPGPFPSQSIASLERNLVKSARLAQSWTTRPMRDVSCIKINLEGETTMRSTPAPKLLHGRWLVVYEPNRRFVLHDTQTGARRVLWERDKLVVSPWDVCSMTSPEGQCVVYLLLKPEWLQWKLLEFRLDGESGKLVDSVVMDSPAFTYLRIGSAKAFCAGKSPFLSIPGHGLVFDTRTRIFYELPEFRVALDETFGYIRGDSRNTTRIFFTDTYVVSFTCFYDPPEPEHATVIQMFILPPDGSSLRNGQRVLCLTHEGVMEDFPPAHAEFFKPLVDPVTRAIHLRLLDYTNRARDVQITRIDLTLPEPRPDDVSPMTVGVRHYRLPKEGEPTSRHETCFRCVDVSEEGHVRGFYWGRQSEAYETERVMKFTIDTRQDEWVIDCGKLSPPEWSHLRDTELYGGIMFDGMRGKICFFDPMYCNNENVVVVDIE